MSRLSYYEQLATPQWQERRRSKLASAGWRCSACFGGVGPLHVHHKQYFRGRMAWEYSDDELVALCQKCHEAEHELDDMLRELLASKPAAEGMTPTRVILAMAAGWMSASQNYLIDPDLLNRCAQANPTAFAMGKATLEWLDTRTKGPSDA